MGSSHHLITDRWRSGLEPQPPTLTSAPGAEPVERDEAKDQLRVEHTDDDTLIDRLIAAARQRCEAVTGRSLITQTWQLKLDRWPYRTNVFSTEDRYAVVLPKPPVQSVTSVAYLDINGDSQTLTVDDDYRVLVQDPFTRITPAYNTTWPAIRPVSGAITITYVAGYGDASTDVPQDLRHGMLMLIDHMYRNRSDEVTNASVSKFSTASDAIFRSHAVGVIG